MSTINSEIAKTILAQMGGMARLSGFIGAKNFCIVEKGVTFRWSGKSKNKTNFLKVTLNGSDLYDVEFCRLYAMKFTVIETFENLFFDQLIKTFEEQTGLYLTL